ncbi:alpha-L-arabinofuranosidase C-terminal domain-containing protein [Halarchaeum sp. P4]|uniref:alpha-L-arabinofuranosidase C-terminal domain-containing protein n=1 Tax=Halarchaeum sp. P4 TaxID=3421639 RepID=UPI003EBD9CE7
MTELYSHTGGDGETASVTLDPSRRADYDVPAELFGKFIEHLYSPWRVKNALEAQTLFNPTLGSWKFQHETYDADGGRGAIHDHDEIAERVETYVETHDLPGAERLEDAYHGGCAFWWFHHGDGVRTSPDVGVAGDRAQRIEVGNNGRAGIAQWCFLPLHRTDTFEGDVALRATDETTVRLALHETDDEGDLGDPVATTTVTAGETYDTHEFEFAVEDYDCADDAVFGFSVTTAEEANLVVDHVRCYPDDHVNTADPEIVELLRDAELPVLRWPGGNFVSGYHWEDGIGPIEERPTKPNPAWDGIEPNLFGTHEFLEFCEAVGCEPMICLNAGDGSTGEAARWVEYCNGDPETTEMGALRAEHGHPEPYDVTYWEVGNEVYGPWQVTWTTPDGYADRLERFTDAMTAVDDDIEVFACGNRLTDWNDPFLASRDELDWLTDHVLLECHADASTDPVEVYNAHSGIAHQLREEYDAVREDCEAAGLGDTRLAITELQLFTRFDEGAEGDAMTEADLPRNSSITEAVFDTSIVNACIRDDFVRMVTHSGVGNHGAGVRKVRERTHAEPAYYGQRLGLSLAGGTPVGVDVTCGTFSTETTFGADTAKWFGQLDPVEDAPAVDVTAVEDPDDHDAAALLVHRDAGRDDIAVELDGGGLFTDHDDVTVTTLTADEMTAENTYEDPENVTPTESTAAVEDGTVSLTLPQYGVVRVTAD